MDMSGRRALPPETDCVLGYDELIDTLVLLEDEQVCLFRAFGEADGTNLTSRLGIVGALRHLPYTWAHCFAIGEGRLLLWRGDFVGARLWTFDGNDNFQITLRFGDEHLIVGDVSSLALDEFDSAKEL